MVGKSTPVRKAGKNLAVPVGYPFRPLGATTSPLVIHNLDRVYQDSELAMTGCSVSILRKLKTTKRRGRKGASVKYVRESAIDGKCDVEGKSGGGRGDCGGRV